MRFGCPQCSEIYDVPDAKITNGKASKPQTLLCPKCHAVFPLNAANSVAPEPIRRIPKSIKWYHVALMGAIVFTVTFLGYLTYHNKGVLELDKLPDQVQVAIEGAPPEQNESTDIEQLSVALDEGYKLKLTDGNLILVVKGQIENPADVTRNNIILQGQIVDKAQKVRFTSRAPCGKVIANRKLKRIKKGKFAKLFVRRGEFINCILKPGQKKKFQLIFDDMPTDFSDNYSVRVKTLFAGHTSTSDTVDSKQSSGKGKGL
jgi:hypothetical protein